MTDNKIDLQQVNILVPPEYLEAAQRFLPQEVVDADEVREIQE